MIGSRLHYSNERINEQMGVRTAENFLAVSFNAQHIVADSGAQSCAQEIKSKPGLNHKYRLMENFVLLHSHNKADVERALAAFLEMCPEAQSKDAQQDDSAQVPRHYEHFASICCT